ncbi:MAG: hypothetical protein AAGI38_01900 [Bacteroidota bacterium]
MSALQFEQPREDLYKEFAHRYEISQFEQFVALYDVNELMDFMPSNPSEDQKQIFNELIGVGCETGYMDYAKSNNTFELIMQWQERTGYTGPLAVNLGPDGEV